MENNKAKLTPSRSNGKKIFISWSGNNSKDFAKELKDVLENVIFKNTGLSCFVSDVDIYSGDDWWRAIKDELISCKLGIVCLTKENIRSPWIHFESGAMVARDLKVIPLLIQCGTKNLSGTPLATRQAVDFNNPDKFAQMIKAINKDLRLLKLDNELLDKIAKDGHGILATNAAPIIAKLNNQIGFSARYIYPSNVKHINQNSIYISASMSSIPPSEYVELQKFVVSLEPLLKTIGFTEVMSPVIDNPDYTKFDGSTKAIKDNFKRMKQAKAVLVIYPKSKESSVLPEIGYALALSKRTVIFYKETLPYILTEAGSAIPHIYSKQFSRYEEITHTLLSNGKELFEYEEESEE